MCELTKINKLEIELGLYQKTATENFYENPCERTLRAIPKRIQTTEMVKLAIEHDGMALKSVSKKLITNDLCKAAVIQNGLAIKYVPEPYLTKEMYKLAVTSNGLSIAYVPKNQITKELSKIAVSQPILAKNIDYPLVDIPEKYIDENIVNLSVQYSPCSLKNVPYKYITKDLIISAVSGDGMALAYVPKNRISKEVITLAIKNNPFTIEFVPESKCTKELCTEVFMANPFVLRVIPEQYITTEMCLEVISRSSDEEPDKRFKMEWFPESMRNNLIVIDALVHKIGAQRIIDWNNRLIRRIEDFGEEMITTKPLSDAAIKHLQAYVEAERCISLPPLQITEVEIPALPSGTALINIEDEKSKKYDLSLSDDSPSRTIYYISDLHIEHQLKDIFEGERVSLDLIDICIEEKIREMLSSVKNPQGYLLIGGDVAHTSFLIRLFYKKLTELWGGTVISVLGNHEIWDNHPEGIQGGHISRPLEEIVNDYREIINTTNLFTSKSVLLQNEIYILYKNKRHCVINENQLANSSDEDLRDILSKASLIVLGGIGFSGLNPKYNANRGLYRSAVTTIEEDRALSSKFKLLHDKLKRCAGDKHVIVLTHTPVYDWTNEPCNPNWIYINGHNHQNSIVRNQDGTTILSDNQVGYKPTKWKLNGFMVDGWYDPFKELEDGIHEISSETYQDFYNGRGIFSNGCNYPGNIYMLKKNGLYMFLLKSASSLCILSGGTRKKLDNNDILYYYDNMDKYSENVYITLSPYQQALKKLSEEVKLIGGWGRIHGCIVDIDFCNHIYLNPFDGKVTPYYATDMLSRLAYNDIFSMLKNHRPELSTIYQKALKSGKLLLLNLIGKEKGKCQEDLALATVPQMVLGTEMYSSSRIMRSMQYIFESNVIRIWNDALLSADLSKESYIALKGEKSNK